MCIASCPSGSAPDEDGFCECEAATPSYNPWVDACEVDCSNYPGSEDNSGVCECLTNPIDYGSGCALCDEASPDYSVWISDCV